MRTISLDNWMDKIQMVAFHHPAMTPVYKKYTTNQTLSIPKKKWVDDALFNLLQLFIEPATRQLLDPAKISTSSGVVLWKLLKEKAPGDLTVNREQAHKRLITMTIQLYMEFIEHVQKMFIFVAKQARKYQKINYSGILLPDYEDWNILPMFRRSSQCRCKVRN